MRLSIAALALALMLPAAGQADPPPIPQGAENAAKPAPGGPRPVIEIPVTAFSFGDLYHQDQYTHTFIVRNKGKADLVIAEVKPG
jgi:hypothetical protein